MSPVAVRHRGLSPGSVRPYATRLPTRPDSQCLPRARLAPCSFPLATPPLGTPLSTSAASPDGPHAQQPPACQRRRGRRPRAPAQRQGDPSRDGAARCRPARAGPAPPSDVAGAERSRGSQDGDAAAVTATVVLRKLSSSRGTRPVSPRETGVRFPVAAQCHHTTSVYVPSLGVEKQKNTNSSVKNYASSLANTGTVHFFTNSSRRPRYRMRSDEIK